MNMNEEIEETLLEDVDFSIDDTSEVSEVENEEKTETEENKMDEEKVKNESDAKEEHKEEEKKNEETMGKYPFPEVKDNALRISWDQIGGIWITSEGLTVYKKEAKYPKPGYPYPGYPYPSTKAESDDKGTEKFEKIEASISDLKGNVENFMKEVKNVVEMMKQEQAEKKSLWGGCLK